MFLTVPIISKQLITASIIGTPCRARIIPTIVEVLAMSGDPVTGVQQIMVRSGLQPVDMTKIRTHHRREITAVGIVPCALC